MYLPVLMGMAEILWDVENWPAVEKIFKTSAEFCSDQETWQLNVAHVLFREERWDEAIRYYLPLIRNVRRLFSQIIFSNNSNNGSNNSTYITQIQIMDPMTQQNRPHVIHVGMRRN